MERLNDAKLLLEDLYEQYVTELQLAENKLDLEDIKSIEKTFESVYRADSFATRNKSSFPRTLSQNLRKAFADLLLLMEGKDIKIQAEINAQNALES